MRHVVSLLLAASISVVGLAGCSGGKPSTSDAEKVLSNLIQAQSKGVIRLKSFDKKNARDGEVFGQKIYAVDYEATIEFLDACYWGSPLGAGAMFETVKGTPGPMNAWMYQGKRPAAKGQTSKVNGQLLFEKTEKGWRGSDGKIY